MDPTLITMAGDPDHSRAPGEVVIGVDGGGTKTLAVIADARGHELARVVGAGANLQTVGALAVRDRLRSLFTTLVENVRDITTVRAVTVALAGVDRPADVPVATQAINEAIGSVALAHPAVRWALATGLPSVTNDAVAALAAGARTRDGVVVIAGTGSIAFGICDGKRARAGGWGSILGDEGSGYALGYDALRAVARAHDGRAPVTTLTDAILSHLGATTAPDLIGIVSAASWGVAETASLAPLVVLAAEAGDPVAVGIVTRGAHELSMAALAVIRELQFDPSRTLALVQAGGLWPASPLLRVEFERRVLAGAPFVRPVVSEAEPVHGAIWLARRDAGLLNEGLSA
jgi:N-acetylglucosamine kinase